MSNPIFVFCLLLLYSEYCFVQKKIHNQLSLETFCNLSNGIHRGNMITDEYVGEIICDVCGAVLEEKILSYKTYQKEDVVF